MPDTALLIIDMQRAMLKDAHDGEACLARVAELADRARVAGVPVVYLRQQFDTVPAEWLEVHPALTPEPGDVVLDKESADSFLGTTLGKILEEHAVRRLVVTGFASDFCVDSTGRSALSHGYDLVLVADGHTTIERPAGVEPTAAQIVAHHNGIFAVIQYAGRSVTVTRAADIRFAASRTT
ncbi:isochorismatase family protein [Streptomyces fuscichromogenes]|uniref:Isochorismatase n=1 Tax=Streptomyces fuscichromogenes TaxID=1324013 RepID=A0A917XNZ1_9ACTN|nr:isochorismatase family protein [Streptomyces fuscichromogenes]GGN41966.1 isochorismatase [Streptomyces fuscichromogenes]